MNKAVCILLLLLVVKFHEWCEKQAQTFVNQTKKQSNNNNKIPIEKVENDSWSPLSFS